MFGRRTVITFEKLERCSYRISGAGPVSGTCDECGQDVDWITPHQTVALTGLTLREIFQRIEANLIHFTESAPGLVYICIKSLKVK